MARSRDWLIAGAAVAALLLWPRRASASINPNADIRFPDGAQWHDAPDGWTPSADYFDPVYGDAWTGDAPELDTMGANVVDLAQLGVGLPDFYTVDSMELADDPQVKAFLYMIRRAEHTEADVRTGMDYATFYGGTRFTDLSDHPVNTGELQPVKLSPAMCRAAGYASGNCVTTAAGAYQFTRPTWNRYRAQEPRLPDFSARSQDIAAARLLRDLGVERLLRLGDFQGAVYRASSTWASLPGSTAGQGGRTLAQVAQAFTEGGGTVA